MGTVSGQAGEQCQDTGPLTPATCLLNAWQVNLKNQWAEEMKLTPMLTFYAYYLVTLLEFS